MKNEREKILHAISQLAGQMFGKGGGNVFLYGSQARNDAGPDSDWDLLVIIDDSVADADAFNRYAFPFAEIGWHFNAQITPIHYTRSQWEAQRNTLFYHNVSAQAIRLK